MFCSNKLNSGIPYQTSPSGGNCSNDVSGTIFHIKIGSGHAYHVNDEHLRGNNAVVASLDLRIMDAQWLCEREAKYHSRRQKRASDGGKTHFCESCVFPRQLRS